MENQNENRALTFGEKAVGITFNPGKNEKVELIKMKCAYAIDVLNDEREWIKNNPAGDGQDGERIRLLSIAITDLQSSVMWGVKAVTWNT